MAANVTKTTRDVITDAMRAAGILGAGETAAAEDAAYGLSVLKDLLASWSADSSLSYRPDLWGTTETDENELTPWGDRNLITTPMGRSRDAVTMIETVATLDTTITLPGEYFRALRYALAVEIGPAFQSAPNAEVQRLMLESMAIVRRRNAIAASPNVRDELPSFYADRWHGNGPFDILTRS